MKNINMLYNKGKIKLQWNINYNNKEYTIKYGEFLKRQSIITNKINSNVNIDKIISTKKYNGYKYCDLNYNFIIETKINNICIILLNIDNEEDFLNYIDHLKYTINNLFDYESEDYTVEYNYSTEKNHEEFYLNQLIELEHKEFHLNKYNTIIKISNVYCDSINANNDLEIINTTKKINVINKLQIKTESIIRINSILKQVINEDLTLEEQLELDKMLQYHYSSNIKEIYSIIGSLYLNKKDSKCIEYLKKGVELTDYKSYYLISTCYIEGTLIETDYKEAYKFLNESKNHIKESYYYLALLYKEGLGVEVDYDKALKYLNIIEKDDTYEISYNIRIKTTNLLANMYINGLGVKQDVNKAFYYYRKIIFKMSSTIVKSDISTVYDNLKFLKENYKEEININDYYNIKEVNINKARNEILPEYIEIFEENNLDTRKVKIINHWEKNNLYQTANYLKDNLIDIKLVKNNFNKYIVLYFIDSYKSINVYEQDITSCDDNTLLNKLYSLNSLTHYMSYQRINCLIPLSEVRTLKERLSYNETSIYIDELYFNRINDIIIDKNFLQDTYVVMETFLYNSNLERFLICVNEKYRDIFIYYDIKNHNFIIKSYKEFIKDLDTVVYEHIKN